MSGALPTERTKFGKALILLIVGMPMLGTVAYGAVDAWALIPIALMTIGIAGLWLGEGLKKSELAYSNSWLSLPLLGLVALGCVQLLPLGGPSIDPGLLAIPASESLSLDPFSTRIFTIRLGFLFIFFVAALTFISDKKLLKRIALAVVVFGAIMAFAGILQRLASPDAIYGMRATPQAIPFGPFVNQHHFAALMEMTGGMTLALLFGNVVGRDRKPLLIIAGLLMLIAVIMTGSRGGMISTVGTAGFVLLMRRRVEAKTGGGSRFWIKIVAAAAIFVIAVAAVFFLSGADPLIRGTGLGGEQGDVTSGRAHFWSVALRIFLDNPIVGAGLDAFGVAFTKYDTWNGIFRVEQAHNDYLQALADGGIVGFGCIALFITLFLKRGFGVIRLSKSPTRKSIAIGAMGGCIGIFIHSFFDFPLRTPSNAYFFLLLVTLATIPVGDVRDIGEEETSIEPQP